MNRSSVTPRFSFLFLTIALVTAVNGQPAAPSRVETIQFHSNLVGEKLPYSVILPVDYRRSTATRYPVLYLLHGLTGHYSDWLTRTNIADYAARYPLIVVMPEGNNGWYTDSAGGPTDKYETYILEELIPEVQKRYRTIEARHGRAIAGLSMGGYGAIKFGLKHPDRFAFAGSMSGAFAVTRYEDKNSTANAAWNSILTVFGPLNSETRRANDLNRLVLDLSPSRVAALPYFYFDCGTEDSTAIFSSNRELSEVFLRQKIPHEYRELPGNHSWAYWDQQVQEVLEIAANKLRMPAIRGNHRDPGKAPHGNTNAVWVLGKNLSTSEASSGSQIA